MAEVLQSFESDAFDDTLLQRTLLAYYRLLRAAPSVPRLKNWSLASLISALRDSRSGRGSKLLAIRCYALQTDMAEWRRLEMEEECVGQLGIEDCTVYYGQDPTGTVVCADGWLLSILEAKRVAEYRTRLLSAPNYYDGGGSNLTDADLRLATSYDLPWIFTENYDCSPHIVCVHGILMLRSGLGSTVSIPLVSTSSAIKALRQVTINL